ncbi:hypothetical protein H112_04107, partial [Trichophyton rubrum D6]
PAAWLGRDSDRDSSIEVRLHRLTATPHPPDSSLTGDEAQGQRPKKTKEDQGPAQDAPRSCIYKLCGWKWAFPPIQTPQDRQTSKHRAGIPRLVQPTARPSDSQVTPSGQARKEGVVKRASFRPGRSHSTTWNIHRPPNRRLEALCPTPEPKKENDRQGMHIISRPQSSS